MLDMASWAKVSIVLLLAVQAYTCAALNKQENGWLSKHLRRPQGTEMRPSRHLAETTEQGSEKTGWRGSLIHPSHKQGTANFTILQSIQQDVEISKERARVLDQRARNAPYTHHQGRMALDFVSNIHVTPGSYSMEISIGTPPQNFIAIADTGSDLVWLQCATCDLCFESAKFDPSASSTYVPLGCPGCDVLGSNKLTCTPNCQYSYFYGDQSTTQGDFSLETITLNSTDGTQTLIPNFEFGCGRRNNGTFLGTDGLIGLARGPISFPSQIAPALNDSVKFSYCLHSRYDPETETSPIFFGEAAIPTNLTGVNYTGILTPSNTSVVPYYYVQLVSITVGDDGPLDIPSSAFAIDPVTGNGGTIFDSGTTYTILNSVAYEAVTSAYQTSLAGQYTRVDLLDLVGLSLCYDITGLDTVTIQNLAFNFEGADFDLPFDNIMVLFNSTGQDLNMCLAILETSDQLNIFGNVQQQNFQVLHDEDNLRIGWVPVDCKSL